MKCNACQLDKDDDDFQWRNKHRPELGRRRVCKACETVARRAYRKTSGPSGKMTKQQRLKQRVEKFGLTLDEFQQMLDSQDGVCKICGGIGQRELAIDHDHDTKHVRALLCTRCNVGLGYFRDDPALLRRAAEYLETCRISSSVARPVDYR